VYAWPFARAVEAGVGSVMCSYNKVNGTYACENDNTLTKILKQEMRFQGFVQSDWTATHSGAKSANAGLDMDMPGPDAYWGSDLVLAVKNGDVSEARLDDLATRILATWYKFGQDQNYPAVAVTNDTVDVQSNHKETIRAIGAASAVLLKNDNHILPLSSPKSIGILGNDAGSANYGPLGCTELPCLIGTIASGYGSGGSYYPYLITPEQGIKSRAPNSTTIKTSITNLDPIGAAAIAKSVEVPIVFVGADAGEGFDRLNMDLDSFGNELINTVAKHNNNTIVVIHAADPVLMPWIDNVGAVVYAGLPGQETGNSIADVLFGDVNPSGRLPYTLAKKASDYPAQSTFSPQVEYTEGLLIGHRWFDAKNITPQFEFGFGLSYTNFSYNHLSISKSSKTVTVNATIKNIGKVSGAEVPQLYLGFPKSAREPPKILRGFDKLTIEPNKQKRVSFDIDISRELSIWNTTLQNWTVVQGEFDVFVGASSRDIRLTGSFSI
jgi:beta-glucosidase